jgi:hypothetical protein
MTEAHVIPSAVGGRLAVEFLCAGCNSRLGHTVEKGLKSDPRLRLSIEQLKDDVPDLADKMRARQPFVARDEEGRLIRGTPYGEGYSVLDSPQDDGSRIKDPVRARDEIETTLRRRNADEEEIEAALAAHDAAADGELVEVASGLSIRKGSVSDFGLPFSEPLVEDLGVLSIGYLFLAIVFPVRIYDLAFQPIRDALLGRDKSSVAWRVESFIVRARGHEPWHGLAVDKTTPHIVVQVRLFAHHAWQVEFLRVTCTAGTPVRSYRLELDTGEEEWVGAQV